MKKVIGLVALLTGLTGMTAFAAPMARTEGFHKTAIVAHKNHGRKGTHKGVKKAVYRRNERRAR